MADVGTGRSPLQGGLPPATTGSGAVVEIACDESGFSGTNLLHSTEPVITHAGTDLHPAEASALIATLRLAPRELKSGHVLRRPGADKAAVRFLAELTGRARVHLVDKEFFLVTRVIDLLLTEPSYTAGTHLTATTRSEAHTLYVAARPAGEPWRSFLAAFEDMVRTKRRAPAAQVITRFFQARDILTQTLDQPLQSAILRRLDRAAVEAIVARLDADDREIPPPLEPLIPALAETILFWSAARPAATALRDQPDSGDQRRVLVIHDEQSALTADRLTRLGQALADPGTGISPLAGLVMADSRNDPRIQVADLLAGIARRRPDLLPADLLSPTSLTITTQQPDIAPQTAAAS